MLLHIVQKLEGVVKRDQFCSYNRFIWSCLMILGFYPYVEAVAELSPEERNNNDR